jgi:hypothetical protein
MFYSNDRPLTIGTISDRGFETVLGNEDFRTGARVLTETRSRISFGTLSCVFEFQVGPDEEQGSQGILSTARRPSAGPFNHRWIELNGLSVLQRSAYWRKQRSQAFDS